MLGGNTHICVITIFVEIMSSPFEVAKISKVVTSRWIASVSDDRVEIILVFTSLFSARYHENTSKESTGLWKNRVVNLLRVKSRAPTEPSSA